METSELLLPRMLETPRLMLRPHQFSDVDDVLAIADDAEWAQYLPVPQPYEARHAEAFLARQVLLDWSVHPSWAIVHGGSVAGGINLRLDHANQVGELGYSIASHGGPTEPRLSTGDGEDRHAQRRRAEAESESPRRSHR